MLDLEGIIEKYHSSSHSDFRNGDLAAAIRAAILAELPEEESEIALTDLDYDVGLAVGSKSMLRKVRARLGLDDQTAEQMEDK